MSNEIKLLYFFIPTGTDMCRTHRKCREATTLKLHRTPNKELR
jgi:hypothetical protein